MAAPLLLAAAAMLLTLRYYAVFDPSLQIDIFASVF
jgi:hypothetical protein